MVDWSSAVLSILTAVRREDRKINPRYLAIKPRVLSDHNILRGVAALRAVLAFVPPASIAAAVLGLGSVGFNLWKHIALRKEYDELKFPPVDPNVMRIHIRLDKELSKHYGHLTAKHNWGPETISELEQVYNDFSFITSFELLHKKYPHIDEEYVRNICLRNKEILGANLYQIEQEILKVSKSPEIDTNIKDAIEALKSLFPVMRDWSLFNSEGFKDIVRIIDTVI